MNATTRAEVASPASGEVRSDADRDADTMTVHLDGELDVAAARELHGVLGAAEKEQRVRAVVVDFADAGRMHSAVVATLTLAARRLRDSGKRLSMRGLGDHHRAAFELASAAGPATARPRGLPILEAIGDRAVNFAAGVRAAFAFAASTARAAGRVVTRRRSIPLGAFVQQASFIGADALPIVGLLSLLLGLTIAFQSALALDQFGAGLYLADIVSLSMVRELGPMMTAILVSARSGSAITSELAAMNVREEVDAMRTMGLDPFTHLVLPRLVALTVVLPALTLIAILLGCLGGLAISRSMLDLSASTFAERAIDAVVLGDFGHGLGKSVLFAWIIGVTACATGLGTRGGSQNIGRATTRSVVTSLFLIIVADSIIATFLAVTG
jgi:phospholipid/cholesterol/gamma-HCH transport system permease protein